MHVDFSSKIASTYPSPQRLHTRLIAGFATACLAFSAAVLGFASEAHASSRDALIGGLVIVVQADSGCASISGTVGPRRVSVTYSEIFDEYNGNVDSARVSVRYSEIFEEYNGNVGSARVNIRYSEIFEEYKGNVGSARVNVRYSEIFEEWNGSIGSARVNVRYSEIFDEFNGTLGSQRVKLSCQAW